MALAAPGALALGAITASAGNMAQGVACHVVVPEHAPRTKLDAIERLGSRPIPVPFDEWWQVIVTHRYAGLDAAFVHPVCDRGVIAGNGAIGLEILEDLPDLDAVVVPYGGGGLSNGIASAIRATKHQVPVFAAEVETAAPLAASIAAGSPQEIDYTPSFVDGIGGKSVLEEMWPLVRDLLNGSLVVTLEQVVDAIRLLVTRAHVVAEGARASSVAAALAGGAGGGKVCVVSGGNIDAAVLGRILRGRMP